MASGVPFGLLHGANEIQGELPLQADEERTACHAVDGLTCQSKLFYWCGEGEATFEEDFVEDVLSRAAVADVVNVEFELLLQRAVVRLRHTGSNELSKTSDSS